MEIVMLVVFLQSLWFFLPVLAANQCALWANHFDLPLGREPVDVESLGANKTRGPWIYGPFVAILVVGAQGIAGELSGSIKSLQLFDYQGSLLGSIGFIMGIGAIAGDQLESRVKRIAGIEPGKPWIPFDQLDFMLGGLLALPLTGWIGWEPIAMFATVFFCVIYPIGNYVSYKKGIRKSFY